MELKNKDIDKHNKGRRKTKGEIMWGKKKIKENERQSGREEERKDISKHIGTKGRKRRKRKERFIKTAVKIVLIGDKKR